MSSLPRRCLDCTATIASGTRCSACARRTDAARGTRQQRGYDNAWLALAREAIQAQPWCSDCGHWGDHGNPLTGDHRRWPAVTVDDVDVVCRRCNSKRGAKRRNNSDSRTAKNPRPAEILVSYPDGVSGLA